MSYTAADLRQQEFRLFMLLCGPGKCGKSTVCAETSPGPIYIINTDGKSGLQPAMLLGAEFTADDVSTQDGFERCVAFAKAHKEFKTVIFDNLTTYAEAIDREIRLEMKPDGGEPDGRQFYPRLERALLRTVHLLKTLPQHVIICAHTDRVEKDEKGSAFEHMLSIAGGAKKKVPILVHDWVKLVVNVSPSGKVMREFLLAPEGDWMHAVRSIQNIQRIPADVSKFIELASSKKVVQTPKPSGIRIQPSNGRVTR